MIFCRSRMKEMEITALAVSNTHDKLSHSLQEHAALRFIIKQNVDAHNASIKALQQATDQYVQCVRFAQRDLKD